MCKEVGKNHIVGNSAVYNMDCVELMRSFPDKHFNLAVVDPPYGLPKDSSNGRGKLKNRIFNKGHISDWDIAPPKEYWDELFRVSRNQIIWGGNYFPLPPTRCIVVWDKVQPWENFSQVELAWTSFDYPAKLFRYDNRTGDKIHACQKPISLYGWIYNTFAQEGDRILDTHLGSGTNRIAAYKLGLEFCGCEIDDEYFDNSIKLFNEKCLGVEEINGIQITQMSLFE